MGILTKAGATVLCLAITIGVVGKIKPELFLRLPMGFIPWAITGNEMPPYFDSTPFAEDEFGTWTKDKDLIVSTGAKSGTNWMLYCAHQIRTKAKGDTETDFTDVLLDTPWVGFSHYPGQKWAEIKEMMNTTVLPDGSKVKDYWDNPSFPFRIFKSHYPPPVMPVNKYRNVKFLAMARNGKDVIKSWLPFFASHTPTFKKQWGSFPLTYSESMACLKEFLPGGPLVELYFGYVKAWWPYRNDPNVLMLHYEDAKADLRGTVQKLASFIDVELTDSEETEVTRRCGIDHMKSVADKFDMIQWAGDGTTVMCGTKHCPGVEGSLIRSGKSGEGDAFFTEEMKALWDAAVESELPDIEMRKWAQSGGSYN